MNNTISPTATNKTSAAKAEAQTEMANCCRPPRKIQDPGNGFPVKTPAPSAADKTLELLKQMVASMAQILVNLIELLRRPANNKTNYLYSPSGPPPGRSGQFLWKPESDKDGKLAVLTPPSLSGKVEKLQLVDPQTGKVIETGQDFGRGNGNRMHFRFNKPGGSYPDGVVVRIGLSGGESQELPIKDSSARFTY